MSDLSPYFQQVQTLGNLPTAAHAQRWSTAVLRALSLNLSRKTKRQLAKALPEELAADLTRVFWLAHFRDMGMTQVEFQKEVGKRAGVTDAQVARTPVTAVFHGLKLLTGKDISDQIGDALAPKLGELWRKA